MKRREIVCHRSPQRFEIDPFIGVAEMISNAPNIAPWLIGDTLFRFISQPDCRLTDDLQLGLNGRHGHRSRPEIVERHSGGKLPDHRYPFRDIPEQALRR